METKTTDRYFYASWAFGERLGPNPKDYIFLQVYPDTDYDELRNRATELVRRANAFPELLEALEAARKAIGQLSLGKPPSDELSGELMRIIYRADELLKRAKGGNQ